MPLEEGPGSAAEAQPKPKDTKRREQNARAGIRRLAKENPARLDQLIARRAFEQHAVVEFGSDEERRNHEALNAAIDWFVAPKVKQPVPKPVNGTAPQVDRTTPRARERRSTRSRATAKSASGDSGDSDADGPGEAGPPLAARVAVAEAWQRILSERHPSVSWSIEEGSR
jgi:hypothetical protein